MLIICVSEQCLRRVKTFSVSPTAPAVSRLGVDEELGGGPAGTAGAHWKKGYPIPCYSVPNKIELGEKKEGGTLGVMTFVFPSNLCVINPCFPGDG